MIKIKKLIKEFVEYRIPKVGIGKFLHDADFDKLKSDLDSLGYIGRYNNEDMIPKEDYVIIKSDKTVRLYSKKIVNDPRVNKIFNMYKMTPWRSS